MDAPVIEIAAPAREVLSDHRGSITGTLEPERLTGKVVALSPNGIVVGVYDPRSNETRDAHGRVVGRGNLHGALLLQRR